MTVDVGAAASDPLALLDDVLLSEEEQGYVAAARAANTLRGYRSDWAEWCSWCKAEGLDPLPAKAAAISSYLTFLAGHGAKVGTMARRLSALRFAHRLRGMPDPTEAARVVAVWEGIRRTHGAPPLQAAPLMPPELWDVIEACPTTKTWRTKGRAPEPDLAGAHDRALLLVSFVAALRRSELASMRVDHLVEHPQGLVLSLPRSKTNQEGTAPELVVLPRGASPRRCRVTALQAWIEMAGITTGAVRGQCPRPRRPATTASTPSRSTSSSRPPSPGPVSRPAPTRPTRCAPASSPTPTYGGPRTGPSPTRPATLACHPRGLRAHPRGLGGQRGHPARGVVPATSLRDRNRWFWNSRAAVHHPSARSPRLECVRRPCRTQQRDLRRLLVRQPHRLPARRARYARVSPDALAHWQEGRDPANSWFADSTPPV